jgi:hypothetical protein
MARAPRATGQWISRSALALAGLVLATLVVGGAAAAPQRTVQLKIGDAVDVTGTRVACFALQKAGKKGVGCALWAKNKPVVRSYSVGLAVDGTAVLSKINADGSSVDVFKRRLAARGSPREKVYRLRVGDVFGLQIDARVALGCRVINVTDTALAAIYRGVKVSCWRATATKPLPHTYGISISDKFAGVFAFDARSKITAKGVLRKQPR